MVKYFLFLLSFFTIFSQELPPIQSFDIDEYNASGQNWMITQDDDQNIFVANNDGLLTYNGSTWELYKTPKNTILRSVKYINNIIYTGENSDFGYWIKNKNGFYSYTSLPTKFSFDLVEDEEFWNIVEFKNWIVFQSLSRLVFYDPITEEIRSIFPNSEISIIEEDSKSFVVEGKLYFYIVNQGLYVIEDGKYIPFNTSNIIRDNTIIGLFNINTELLALTQNAGFFKIKSNNEVSKFNSYLDDLNELYAYSVVKNNNDSFSIGTVGKGLIILDENGNLNEILDKGNSILNNTVLSVYEDFDNNIWLGLDNGISVVNYNSPFKIYEDYEGLLGTVYAFKKHNDYIYVGTNQGLYYKKDSPKSNFSLLDGLTGQVWSLEIVNGELFCGHDNGTFIINNNNYYKVSGTQGSWTFRLSKTKDLIFEGHYSGINVLEKTNGFWKIRNSLSNKVNSSKNNTNSDSYEISTRFFELTENNKIISVHGYKGVYKLDLAPYFENIKSFELDSLLSIEGNPSLAKFNNKIYYKNKFGVFYYNESEDSFKIDSILSKAANPTGLIRSEDDKLWIFSNNNLFYAFNDDVSNEVKLNSIFIPNKLKRTVFENISSLDNEKNILGTSSGYISLDLNKYNPANNNFSINKILVNSIDSDPSSLNIESDFILDYNTNNISFEYSISNYELFENKEFQYRLIGYNDNWTNWSSEPLATFNNLMYGSYTFELKAKKGDLINPQIKSISFKIAKPWYLSNFMFINYSLLSGLLLFLTNRYTRRYYVWKEKRLEKINKRKIKLKEIERKESIASFENEKLQQDIDNKNRELAASTMSMIKKNQFLNKIKNDLMNAESDINVNKVIKTIDNNLNNQDDWKFFEEAFNNADREFLKKIKSIHETLTKNDLKLCAYLRLNLSSKDIAPLLNISLRSVEIKRYRLRKKMKLTHNEGLTEYILSI